MPGQHRPLRRTGRRRVVAVLVIGLGHAVVGGVDGQHHADQEGKGCCGEAGPEDGGVLHGAGLSKGCTCCRHRSSLAFRTLSKVRFPVCRALPAGFQGRAAGAEPALGSWGYRPAS